MKHSFQNDFADFSEHAWFNAASEGPLPLIAGKALQEAIAWKSLVYQLDLDKFQRVPRELKHSLGELMNVPERDIILANSASYGIHLLANGIVWRSGDEIILMQNDFPTDILPWLALEKKGVVVKQLKAKGLVITPTELSENINKNTRLVCLPHVHTFSGIKLDVDGFSKICKAQQIIFVLNVAQSVGSFGVDLTALNVDAAVGAGYKWLCGPYGTGFCYLTPELRSQLELNMNYWASTMSDEELQSEGPLQSKKLTSARALDVFGTANFFNFVPLKASIDYFLKIGLKKVEEYNAHLIDHFYSRLNKSKYNVVGDYEKKEGRSNLLFFSHQQPTQNKKIFMQLNEEKIYLALWKNRLRFSPHIYNTTGQIDRLLNVLE